MKSILYFGVLSASVTTSALFAQEPIPNRLIDYPKFLQVANEVSQYREQRRVTEEEFLKMAAEPETLILDARSPDKYALVHVAGAENLSLTDFTAEELAKRIPDPTTRILIYCNNNFENEPIAFASKMAPTSLNLYTFNSLYHYGYRNVYELGPLVNIQKTKLPLAGTRTLDGKALPLSPEELAASMKPARVR